MTGHQQLYEVASFIDTLVPRLAGSQVEYRKHYKNSQTNKMDFYLEFYKNPFMVTADSTEADLIATIRISLMDYVKEKDIRSTGEAVSRYLAMGIFSLLGGNERVGVFGADCQVTERSSGSIVYGFSFGGLSPTGLDRRQALRSATHRSVDRLHEHQGW